MKNVKKDPKKQLEKYSAVFIQLSLVLVLFVVYQVLEHETKTVKFAVKIQDPLVDYVLVEDDKPVVFSKEKSVKSNPLKPVPLIIDVIKVDENEKNTIEAILDPPLIDEPIDIDKVLKNYVSEPNDPIVNDVSFILIEDAPVYKGCEGLSKEANKKCFTKSIKKFVIKRFDIDLAQALGLRPGTYKIFAQFVITKDGTIKELKIKAPHYKLEKEVRGIIKKLPRFTPGMQRKVPVNVKFTLPILFKVE
ncbi:MAG: energy transducer TonB [Flavobacteriaceae bacterium]|nr:energy transducer TonB [Flavobacteriaceae bacterium]